METNIYRRGSIQQFMPYDIFNIIISIHILQESRLENLVPIVCDIFCVVDTLPGEGLSVQIVGM